MSCRPRALRAVAAAAVAADDSVAVPENVSKGQSLREALADVEEMCDNFGTGARAAYHADELPDALKTIATYDGNADRS